MEKKELINKLEAIKNGTFVRIEYECELPVKAELKNQGVKIFKHTSELCRLGISYKNLSEVKAKLESGNTSSKPRKNNYSYEIKNKLCFNSNTEKNYLDVFSCKNNAKKSYYKFVFEDGNALPFESETVLKDMLIPSYFNKKSSPMKRINIENVIALGK